MQPAHRIAGGAVLAGLGLALARLPLVWTAAAVVGALAGALLWRHPRWALVALILVIPFSPLVSVELARVRVGGMEALLALVLGAWLVRMAVRGQIVVPRAPLSLPWLAWLGIVLASWLVALSLGAAIPETLKWAEMLALYLFTFARLERRDLPRLVMALLTAGAAQAALGLYQSLWQAGPKGFVLVEGQFLRAYGTFQQPNPFAGYLGLIFPLAFSLALWSVGNHLARPKPLPTPHSPLPTPHSLLPTPYPLLLTPYFLLPASALILAGAYASQSRGAWLGLAAGMVVVSAVRSRRAAILFALVGAFLATLLVLGGLGWLPAPVSQRFAEVLPVANIPNLATAEVTDANFPAIERLAHWQAALDMWRDHLWLGVGIGNYPAVYPAYAIGRWSDALGHAHNFYLNVAAETGLIGLLAYAALWLSALWLAWGAIRRSQGAWRAVAVGCLGSLVHLSVHNLVDDLFVQGMYLQVAITLAMLAILRRDALSPRPDYPR